ncbi:UDP-galactose transporter, partial [Klebsormidium nitens]
MAPNATERRPAASAAPTSYSNSLSEAAGKGRSDHERHQIDLKKVLTLGVCVGGIWASYLTQGLLQEQLSTKKFGPDGRRFEHLSFLNLAQNVVCLVWAVVMLQFSRGGGSRGKGQRSPMTAYWLASISNSFGPACGIQALKYISYPAQVLAKSSKMI